MGALNNQVSDKYQEYDKVNSYSLCVLQYPYDKDQVDQLYKDDYQDVGKDVLHIPPVVY
jgi:hypothetical protein